MQQLAPWFVAAAVVLIVAVLQWWVMRRLHVKRLAAVRALHQSAQQTAATMLQQARQQTTQVQLELAAAREAAKRRAHSTPSSKPAPAPATVDAAARERLNKMLDDAPQPEHAVPVDGFADTLPARLFPPSTSFGLLQRSSPRSR